MLASAITFTATFDTTVSPPQLIFTDTTNYPANGVTLAWVLGELTLKSPTGTFYVNPALGTFTQPDTDGAIPTMSKSFNVPLNALGDVPLGDYEVQYDIGIFEPAVAPVYLSKTQVFKLNVVPPNIKIQQTADCDCGGFVSTDLTNYNVTGATLVSVVRTHTVIYPIDSTTLQPVQPDFVTSSPVATLPDLYTNTYTTVIDATVTYVLTDGTIVVYNLTGKKDIDVECESGLCCLLDCIHAVFDKFKAALCKNMVEAQRLQNVVMQIVSAWMIYSIARECEDRELIHKQLSIIKGLIGKEDCGCGCGGNSTDSNTVKVMPLCGITGGSGQVSVVDSCGNGITVTPNTVGDTTTYTVCLNTGIIATIAVNALSGTITNIQSDIALLGSQVAAITSSKYIQLYNNTTNIQNANPSTDSIMQTATLLAGTLADGDEMVIETLVLNNVFALNRIAKIKINTSPIVTQILSPNFTGAYVKFKVTFTRTTAISAKIEVETSVMDVNNNVISSSLRFSGLGVIDMDANPLVIDVTGDASSGNTWNNQYLKVRQFKA